MGDAKWKRDHPEYAEYLRILQNNTPEEIEIARALLKKSIKRPQTYILMYFIGGGMGCMVDSNLSDEGVFRHLANMVKQSKRIGMFGVEEFNH